MRVAIVGSRTLNIDNLEVYIPHEVTEIVSGGADGIDRCAKIYAITNGVKLTEFLPNYRKYRKAAPLKRNTKIVEYSDLVLAFWDGKSNGTKFVISECKRLDVPIIIHIKCD